MTLMAIGGAEDKQGGSGMVTVVTQGAASGLPEVTTLRAGDTFRPG